MRNVIALPVVMVAAFSLLAGCTSLQSLTSGRGGSVVNLQSGTTPGKPGGRPGTVLTEGGQGIGPGEFIELGSGGGAEAQQVQSDPELASASLTLSFVDTDIREVARVLFSEMLNRPYSIDAGISGQVTLRSGGKIDGNAALMLARQAFESSGYTIVASGGAYRVTGLQAGGSGLGANSQTFALQFIDADSAKNALDPVVQGRAEVVSGGSGRLTVRGDAETLALVSAMIDAIDVDQFKNSSFGMFPLRSGSAETVAGELDGIFRAVGVTSHQLIPIERMNAVLVIADKAGHVEFASKWIKRLDQGAKDQRQVFVYQVQNREADDLAALVKSIFEGNAAPGQAVVPVSASTEGQPDPMFETSQERFRSDGPSDVKPGIKITADKGSNTLVVLATSTEYQLIERALTRLDTPLAQVFVEATIAEVRLNNELSHGVRWFLQSGAFSGGISDASSGAVAPSFPGFNFSFKVPQAQIVISALEAYTDVRIVSSPQLTVIDRETATIQVGDQVPIITKSVQDGTGGNSVIANDVTFRDTGVILKVTPQIRSSGEVVLDIEQEVSSVVPTTSSEINSPTISQRKVASKVLVSDGTAIVLGGLMSTREEDGGGGLPGTQKTVLESIFGSKKATSSRSELIVIIRPVIIQNSNDMRQVIDEIASKMSNVLSVEVN